MSEKNILAYFNTPDQAEGTAVKLKALRAIDVQVDRVTEYPTDNEVGYDSVNPVTGNFSSLATLSMAANINGPTPGILASADVDASGMSNGGQDMPSGRDVLLTAVVPEAVFDRARKVVEENGGML